MLDLELMLDFDLEFMLDLNLKLMLDLDLELDLGLELVDVSKLEILIHSYDSDRRVFSTVAVPYKLAL